VPGAPLESPAKHAEGGHHLGGQPHNVVIVALSIALQLLDE
jgi:hypothetical protein